MSGRFGELAVRRHERLDCPLWAEHVDVQEIDGRGGERP